MSKKANGEGKAPSGPSTGQGSGGREAVTSGQPLSAEQSNEMLWKVIARFDTYIGSTNTKAAFLIAFNTFVIGGVILKWQDVREIFVPGHAAAQAVVSFLMLATVALALYSLAQTFSAINPFLTSPKRPNEYHSNIFFGDVKEHEAPEKYLAFVAKLDEVQLQKDLAFQAHELAKGLAGKFASLKNAIRAVIYAQLPALGIIVMIVAWVTVAEVLNKGQN